MQLATINPGATIARATFSTPDHGTFTTDVHAGAVIARGVTDIHEAGYQFQRDHMSWGMVGFVRNGDVWDAVQLLAPTTPGAAEQQIWAPFNMRAFSVAPGVQLDAVWQVSDYGGDYTHFMPTAPVVSH
jgi:hypothetical protein